MFRSLYALASHWQLSDLAGLESTGKSERAKRTSKGKDKKGGREKSTEQRAEIAKWHERDWLKRWLQLEPELAAEDLRPYVFVARDRRFPVGAAAPTARLGQEFRRRIVEFSKPAIILIPLLHVSIARRHFLQSHKAFTQMEDGNYFEYVAREIASCLSKHRNEFPIL